MRDLFYTKRHKYYITLYFLGTFACNCDNDAEVEEEKRKILFGL